MIHKYHIYFIEGILVLAGAPHKRAYKLADDEPKSNQNNIQNQNPNSDLQQQDLSTRFTRSQLSKGVVPEFTSPSCVVVEGYSENQTGKRLEALDINGNNKWNEMLKKVLPIKIEIQSNLQIFTSHLLGAATSSTITTSCRSSYSKAKNRSFARASFIRSHFTVRYGCCT